MSDCKTCIRLDQDLFKMTNKDADHIKNRFLRRARRAQRFLSQQECIDEFENCPFRSASCAFIPLLNSVTQDASINASTSFLLQTRQSSSNLSPKEDSSHKKSPIFSPLIDSKIKMPVQKNLIEFRNLKREEIPQILDLCRKEGRHMGQEAEIYSWFDLDPQGFFVAVNSNGEILGNCVAIRLSDYHGNIGMFVVRGDCRGGGIGTRIWAMAIDHLGDRNKGLSAVPKLFPVYRDRAGFTHVAPWSICLFSMNRQGVLKMLANTRIHRANQGSCGETSAGLPVHYARWGRRSVFMQLQPENNIRTLQEKQVITQIIEKINIKKVCEYDLKIHEYDRSRIVENSCQEAGSLSRLALQDGNVVGYATIKYNLQNMYMFCPVYADNVTVARQLMLDLILDIGEKRLQDGLVLKVPDANIESIALMKELGFKQQDYQLRRCYTQRVHPTCTQHIFALHSSVFCSE